MKKILMIIACLVLMAAPTAPLAADWSTVYNEATTLAGTDILIYWDISINEVVHVKARNLNLCPVLTAEPTDEVVGHEYCFDNDTYDPSSYAGTNDYKTICTATGTPGTFKIKEDLKTGQKFATAIDMRGGTFTADQKNVTYSGNDTISTDEAYGYTMFVTAAAELEMPAVVDGMHFCVENHTADTITLDQNGTETIRLDGAAASATAISGTEIGDMVCCEYFAASTWSCMSFGYTQ